MMNANKEIQHHDATHSLTGAGDQGRSDDARTSPTPSTSS